MTNNEIDYQLALAIGYLPQNVQTIGSALSFVAVRDDKYKDGDISWWRFDHQNPSVILPIMEMYNVFPYRVPQNLSMAGLYCAFFSRAVLNSETNHKNPRTAVALAVLKAAEKGLL